MKNSSTTVMVRSRIESDRVWTLNSPKDPFSVGFRELFIGVGGWYLTQTSGDSFWHVSGPTRPILESFDSIRDRYEINSCRSRSCPMELKLGGSNLWLVRNLLWKFYSIWISGFWVMVDMKLDSLVAIWFETMNSNRSTLIRWSTWFCGDVARTPRINPPFAPIWPYRIHGSRLVCIDGRCVKPGPFDSMDPNEPLDMDSNKNL